jgi:glyoxylase-like metal-dependent hydrolase (beta-lactamase superfamily II)
LIMSIHALIVETPNKTIMVDTCLGNDKQRAFPAWTNLQTAFLNDITEAGYPREKIDTVMCTHLHVDHVGWNTMLVDGEWVPTFTNARYLMAEPEYTYWSENRVAGGHGDYVGDSVAPVMDAGLVDLVPVDHKICDEVWLEPSHGHSPGHVSVRISSNGENALITGDFVHHPCQMARLNWGSTADFDQEAAMETRKRMLGMLADEGTLVIGTHFATPSSGVVKRDGDAFKLNVQTSV